ncbi:hypothetical protein BC830DRAFT_1163060 [Chytriomyces sp. MP71]|nr:hypothetical protein BC830DRAFT_1163060 [Chytriomyces sp. MP71]
MSSKKDEQRLAELEAQRAKNATGRLNSKLEGERVSLLAKRRLARKALETKRIAPDPVAVSVAPNLLTVAVSVASNPPEQTQTQTTASPSTQIPSLQRTQSNSAISRIPIPFSNHVKAS